MTDINVGAITESLNYKADLDLKNTSLIQVVDTLPKNPDENVLYMIPEEQK